MCIRHHNIGRQDNVQMNRLKNIICIYVFIHFICTYILLFLEKANVKRSVLHNVFSLLFQNENASVLTT